MNIDGLSIEQAFDRIYAKSKLFGSWHEIWHIKFNWCKVKKNIIKAIKAENYCLEPLRCIKLAAGMMIGVWSVVDKIVLKIIEGEIARSYKNRITSRCVHVKGHGGLKRAVKELQNELPAYRFIFKTDVKRYYQSIDHHILYNKLCIMIKNKFIQRLLWQYMDRVEIFNGEYYQIKKGIAKGGILSPLLGAIYLEDLDKAVGKKNVHYVRYMDDWVILTKTRSELRKLVKLTHRIMEVLKLTLHPEKTFIGRIRKGFDFLGYRFTKNGLRLATLTIQRFQSKLARLYEQGADQIRIELYRQNWTRWVHASGINCKINDAALMLAS